MSFRNFVNVCLVLVLFYSTYLNFVYYENAVESCECRAFVEEWGDDLGYPITPEVIHGVVGNGLEALSPSSDDKSLPAVVIRGAAWLNKQSSQVQQGFRTVADRLDNARFQHDVMRKINAQSAQLKSISEKFGVPARLPALPRGRVSSTSQIDDSIYFQVWKMVNKEKKSTEALLGSSTNMLDVLSELEKMELNAKFNRAKSAPLKNCFSGMNCVLGDDEKQIGKLLIPSKERNMGYPFAELVGEKSGQSPLLLDAGFSPEFNLARSDKSLNQPANPRGIVAQHQSEYRFSPSSKVSRDPSPGISNRDLENRGIAADALLASSGHVHTGKPVSVSPMATPGDQNSNFLSDENQNQNSAMNRNNISINLTFAMGQYQNAGKSVTPPFYDFQEIKSPRLRPSAKKQKAEISIQTDSDSLSDLTVAAAALEDGSGSQRIGFDDESTSAFPSVIPSRHNCEGYDADTAVCIPETKTLPLSEYIDFQAVVAYTGESVKSFIETADHILNNYIIVPDDNYVSGEDLAEGERKIGISIMRLLGVPQQLRHSIYNEALHSVQALQEISKETVSFINHVIDCVSDGDGGGKEKLIRRLSRVASISTDFQPDSEAWVQFETEFGVFTDTVSEVMKQGYEVSKDVAQRCSETIMIQLGHATPLALMESSPLSDPVEVVEATASTSRRASTVSVRPSLPAISEEIERRREERKPELEAEHEKFLKLKEAFKKLDLDLETELTVEAETGVSASEVSENVSPTWLAVESEQTSKRLKTNGPNFQERTTDAFMEAPLPETENPFARVFNNVCQSLTSSFRSKTQTVLKSVHGTGNTPILGESQCSSRDEPMTLINSVAEDGANGNLVLSEVAYLEAEIHKLAALTDSYFIEPKESDQTPEPEAECPPPPVPKRTPSTLRSSKTVMSIDLEREILWQDSDQSNSQRSESLEPSIAPSTASCLDSNFQSTPVSGSSSPSGISDSPSFQQSIRAQESSQGILDESLPRDFSKAFNEDEYLINFEHPALEAYELQQLKEQGLPASFDPNMNISFPVEEPKPKISELVQNLEKFWPNASLALILTPEAQLQYAMNKYFDANGNKTEVQMSVAALKVLEKPKAGDQPKTAEERPSSGMNVQSDTERLERMIQELRAEVQNHQKQVQIAKPAKQARSKPKPETANPTSIPLPVPESVAAPIRKSAPVPVPKSAPLPPITEPDSDWKKLIASPEIEPLQFQQIPTPQRPVVEEMAMTQSAPTSPRLSPEDIEFQKITGYQDTANLSFVVSGAPNPTSPKFAAVSDRLTRIPARLTSPARPLTAPGRNSEVQKPKPFVFGKPGVPSPSQRQRPQKIQIINTIPFPQPKIARGRPETQPSRNRGHSAFAGSYARAIDTRSTPPPAAESLSRKGSYRQLFQIRQLVSSTQPMDSVLYAQSPASSGNPSSSGSSTVFQNSSSTSPTTNAPSESVTPPEASSLQSSPALSSAPTPNPNASPKKPAFFPF